MELIINYVDEKTDYQRIYASYYSFFTALEGRVLITPLTMKKLYDGKQPGKLSFKFDENLNSAIKAVNDGLDNVDKMNLLEIKDKNGFTLAYARVCWDIAGDGINASIPDVTFAECVSEEFAREFYYSFLLAMEEFIKSQNEEIQIVSAEVPVNNDAYLDAVSSMPEYNTDEIIDGRGRTIIYDKWVRNKPMIRKRTTLPQK